MLALDWRLTLLTLVVLPLFIIPARRIGQKLQRLTREGMQLNASMNNTDRRALQRRPARSW